MEDALPKALEGFSVPTAFTSADAALQADEPGVHVVWDRDGALIYVGESRHTRSRLRQHLSGDRDASILHAKVGRLLDDQTGRTATSAEIREWLEGCTVAVRNTDQTAALKARIMTELNPAFNEILPSVGTAELPDEDARELSDMLLEAMSGVRARATGSGTVQGYKRTVEVDLPTALSTLTPPGFTVRGRTGVGDIADVPWVAMFPAEGLSAKQGVYVVLLFAYDGSKAVLSLNQGTETIKGGSPVLLKRAIDIRSALSPQTDLETAITLGSTSQRPKRYEAANAYAVTYTATAPPTSDTIRTDVLRFLALLADIEESGLRLDRDFEPVHLLMKWSPERKASTVVEHRAVADTMGSVWWGKFGAPGTNAISKARLDSVAGQVAAGVETHCYLYRRGEVWRTQLLEVTADPTHVDAERLPDYYTSDECNLFLRIADFTPMPAEWAAANLLLASKPDPASVAGALGNQTSPLLVFERWTQDKATDATSPADHGQIDSDDLPVLDRAWLTAQTLAEPAWLEDILDTLERRPQIILAGPPGTGKTWVAKALARYLTQDAPLTSAVLQFHASYGYEEFIEGLRPEAGPDGMTFARVDGSVLRMTNQIEDGTDQRHVLILDEMNRANLPRVFGELMYAVEYRGEPVDLMYSQAFALPERLLFIGTMNTADRSIRSLDIALRRRFEVFDCPPDSRILGRYYDDPTKTCLVVDLVEGFERLNSRLTELLDRHHTVGHTFFMAETMTDKLLAATWTRQLQPLFEEYFFDRPDIADTLHLEEFWPDAGDVVPTH